MNDSDSFFLRAVDELQDSLTIVETKSPPNEWPHWADIELPLPPR